MLSIDGVGHMHWNREIKKPEVEFSVANVKHARGRA